MAILQPLVRRGLTASVDAGHSLGGYTEITATDGFELKDSVVLVQKRGRFMQEAVPAGSGLMAAILGMDRKDVEKTCLEAANNGIVTLPDSFSGPNCYCRRKTAVERARELAKSRGARKVIPLAASVPSHCPMMKQAGIALARELEKITIHDLNFPIVNNADAKYLRIASELRLSIVKQLSAGLYWEDSISMIATDGCDTFIEIGPGKVLSGLIRRISKESKVLNVEDQKSMNETLTTLGI